MNNFDNIDVTNPEDLLDLLEEGLSVRYILTGENDPPKEVVAAARNLAKLLLGVDSVTLAKTISFFTDSGGLSPKTSGTMIDLLEAKILDATPDQLNDLVRESKIAGVWSIVKPLVILRNEELAKKLEGYTNPDALDNFLDQMATSDQKWLPGDFYHGTIRVLRQMAKTASMSTLDAIVDIARKWRMRSKVMSAVIERNSELVASIQGFRGNHGYKMTNGDRQVLVEEPHKALRMQDSGYRFM